MNPGNKNRWLLNSLIAYMVLSFLTPVVMYQLRDNNRLIVILTDNKYDIVVLLSLYPMLC